MQQIADKMNFQDPVQKYAECHSWDMSNSNATKYHEIKVGILDNTCFKENVPTFEILVGWILRLGLNFWVINVALYGWKCDPAWANYHWLRSLVKHIVAAKHGSSKPLTSNELWLLELRIKSTRILAPIPDALWDMCKSSIEFLSYLGLRLYIWHPATS